MTSPAQFLNEKLKRRDFFGECILWEFHSTRFGYGLDLSFNYVWDGRGRVREDTLERPMLYVFHLLGVDSIRFSAGFKSAQADPGMVDWGYGAAVAITYLPTGSQGSRGTVLALTALTVRGPRRGYSKQIPSLLI
jgi:hypothetical protein